MKLVLQIILVSAVVFLLQSKKSAAQKFTDKGTSELGGTLAFIFQAPSSNNSELRFSNFIFNSYIGGMFAKGLELAFATSVQSDGRALVGLYLAPAYNFTTGSKIYPFIEGVVGYEIVSSATTGDGVAYGFNVGTKSNISGNFLLIFQLGYLQQNYKTTEGAFTDAASSVTTIAASAGFSIFFP
jgi:hypothetical protein